MINLILDQKWLILFCLEILAWLITFFMLYVRYKMNSSGWFRISAVMFFVTGVIPQTLLGIVNFINAGQFDVFTAVLLMLLLYGFTLGRVHTRRIDRWAKRKFIAPKN
ncbi:hypothetical protein [Pectinatus haikarae]|uniref:hypothetical protein n=1 Tax=Pectinatus haikarae TaxID=349096 RepID=UPI0018C49498|nr:hypothetical protein [Pectinatus haikarae]